MSKVLAWPLQMAISSKPTELKIASNSPIAVSLYFLFILLFLIYINQNLYLIFGDTRIFKILNNINTNDLIKIILNDTSVFDRIMATIFGFKASLNNFFIPGGFYLEKTLNPI